MSSSSSSTIGVCAELTSIFFTGGSMFCSLASLIAATSLSPFSFSSSIFCGSVTFFFSSFSNSIKGFASVFLNLFSRLSSSSLFDSLVFGRFSAPVTCLQTTYILDLYLIWLTFVLKLLTFLLRLDLDASIESMLCRQSIPNLSTTLLPTYQMMFLHAGKWPQDRRSVHSHRALLQYPIKLCSA